MKTLNKPVGCFGFRQESKHQKKQKVLTLRMSHEPHSHVTLLLFYSILGKSSNASSIF